jgi:hypothetical protein
MTLDEVIERLSRHAVVEGVLTLGTTGKDTLTGASDYDLVLVLSERPTALHVGLTTIDRRLADLLFVTVSQVQEILALDGPVDGDAWIGRIVRWFVAGTIVLDRSGLLDRAQQKVRAGAWIQPMSEDVGYGAWFGTNFNLVHTQRLATSDDPVYLMAADWRMVLFGTTDLLFNYWKTRRLLWEGDKEAIRYLMAHDPAFLALFRQFLAESDRTQKLALYEQLAEIAVAPVGPLWADGVTAMTFDLQTVQPEDVQAGLRFWETLISDA